MAGKFVDGTAVPGSNAVLADDTTADKPKDEGVLGKLVGALGGLLKDNNAGGAASAGETAQAGDADGGVLSKVIGALGKTAAKPPEKPLVERAATVPAMDSYIFGYYWEPSPGSEPEWHVFGGNPGLFRPALADALLNKRMTRLYFAANGIWVEVPLPPINSI